MARDVHPSIFPVVVLDRVRNKVPHDLLKRRLGRDKGRHVRVYGNRELFR